MGLERLTRTMNKVFKSIKRKWINTRFANPYKIRLAFTGVQCAMYLSQAMCNISMIRSARAETKEQAMAKKMAITNAVFQSHNYIAQTLKEANR